MVKRVAWGSIKMLFVCFTTLVVCCGDIKEAREPNTYEIENDFGHHARERGRDFGQRVGDLAESAKPCLF
jgi:hypothetical protein